MFEKGKKEEGEEATASLIDEDMRITGSVTSSGDIILAGILDGDINCKNLVVENNACAQVQNLFRISVYL